MSVGRKMSNTKLLENIIKYFQRWKVSGGHLDNMFISLVKLKSLLVSEIKIIESILYLHFRVR